MDLIMIDYSQKRLKLAQIRSTTTSVRPEPVEG
jgi:hypothetical protein